MSILEKQFLSEMTGMIKSSLYPLRYTMLAASIALAGCAAGEGEDEEGGSGGGNNGGGGNPGISAFEEHFHPLVRSPAPCAGCHSSEASPASQTAPFFADPDPQTAENFTLSSGIVQLANAANSSIVLKMKVPGGHFCGDTQACLDFANSLEQGIIRWGNEPQEAGSFNPMDLASAPLMLSQFSEGGAARDNSGVIALYEFKDCSGNMVRDTSGVEPAINLTIMGGATCTPGEGISFDGVAGTRAESDAASSVKIFNEVAGPQGSGEFSVEAWIRYASDNSDGRIFVYDQNNGNHNFQFRQNNSDGIRQQFNLRTVSNGTGGNGQLFENIPDPAAMVEQLDHVVITFQQGEGRKMYVNGELVVNNDNIADTSLSNWDPNFVVRLGGAGGNQQPWPGQVLLAAIYDKALQPAQVSTNFNVGFENKLVASFDVSDLAGAPASVVYEVRDLETAISFENPTFTSTEAQNFALGGLVVVANGVYVRSGQSDRDTQVMINSAEQQISSNGTTVLIDPNQNDVEFRVTFSRFGNVTNEADPIVFTRKTPTGDGVKSAPSGVKNGEQVVAAWHKITGIPRSDTSVLPAVSALMKSNESTQLQSNQQSVLQKAAVEYCNRAITNNNYRSEFLGGLDLGNASNQEVINRLIARIANIDETTQMDNTASFDSINMIMQEQLQVLENEGINPTNRAIAGCASLLASALVTNH